MMPLKMKPGNFHRLVPAENLEAKVMDRDSPFVKENKFMNV
jgi:hypothetical protein